MNETNSRLETLTATAAASVILVVFVDDFVSLVVAVARDWSSLLAEEVEAAAVVVADNMHIAEVSRDEADRVGVDTLLHQNHGVQIAARTEVNWFGRLLYQPDLAWHSTACQVVENMDIQA